MSEDFRMPVCPCHQNSTKSRKCQKSLVKKPPYPLPRNGQMPVYTHAQNFWIRAYQNCLCPSLNAVHIVTHKATTDKKGGQSIRNKHGHYFSRPQLIFSVLIKYEKVLYINIKSVHFLVQIIRAIYIVVYWGNSLVGSPNLFRPQEADWQAHFGARWPAQC